MDNMELTHDEISFWERVFLHEQAINSVLKAADVADRAIVARRIRYNVDQFTHPFRERFKKGDV